MSFLLFVCVSFAAVTSSNVLFLDRHKSFKLRLPSIRRELRKKSVERNLNNIENAEEGEENLPLSRFSAPPQIIGDGYLLNEVERLSSLCNTVLRGQWYSGNVLTSHYQVTGSDFSA